MAKFEDGLVEDALNAACLAIQNALGIEHGDTAGVFFTGSNRAVFSALMHEYIRIEQLGLADVNARASAAKIAEARGYEIIGTGGGCEAFSKPIADSTDTILISNENSVEEDPEDHGWGLGRYGEDGGFVEITGGENGLTLAEALDIADSGIPSPVQGEHYVESCFDSVAEVLAHIATLRTQDFYPNGCETNPLCEAVFEAGHWYWHQKGEAILTMHGPFPTYESVLEDAGAQFPDC